MGSARHAMIAAPIGAALSLGACAAIDPINLDDPQGFAGINHIEVEFDGATGFPESLILYGGKENEDVRLIVELPNGLKAEYEARGAAAFQGHLARAEVASVLGEAGVNAIEAAFPGGLDGLIAALAGL